MKKTILFLLLAFSLVASPMVAQESAPTEPQTTVQVVSAKVDANSVLKMIGSDTASIPIQLNIEITPPAQGQTFASWAGVNWVALGALLLFLLEIALRFTPSTADNSILAFIKRVFDTFFANKKAGGGSF